MTEKVSRGGTAFARAAGQMLASFALPSSASEPNMNAKVLSLVTVLTLAVSAPALVDAVLLPGAWEMRSEIKQDVTQDGHTIPTVVLTTGKHIGTCGPDMTSL